MDFRSSVRLVLRPATSSTRNLSLWAGLLAVVGLPFLSNRALYDAQSAGTAGLSLSLALAAIAIVTGSKKPHSCRPPPKGLTIATTVGVSWTIIAWLLNRGDVLGYRTVKPWVLAGLLAWLVSPRLAHGDRGALLRAWVLLSGMMSLHAISQRLGFDPLPAMGFLGERGQSVLRHPNILAGHLALTLPLVTIAYPLSESFQSRLIGLGAISALSAGLLATGSRAGLLGAGAGLLCWLALEYRERRGRLPGGDEPTPSRWIARVWPAIYAGLFAALALGTTTLLRSGDNLLMSDRVRWGQWQAAWSMFIDRPLIGHGPGCFPRLFPRYAPDGFWSIYPAGDVVVTDACSLYLQIIAEMGAPALLLILVLTWLNAGFIWRGAKSGDPTLASISRSGAGAFAAFLTFSAFHSSHLSVLLVADILLILSLVVAASQSRAAPQAPTPAQRGSLTTTRRVLGAAILLVAIPIGIDGARRTVAQRFFVAASEANGAGQSEIADSLTERALDNDPHHVEALYLKAALEFHRGEYEDALQSYQSVEQEMPGFANLYYNIGLCHYGLGDHDQARRWLERRLEMNPDHAASKEFLRGLDEEDQRPPRTSIDPGARDP